MKSEGEKCQYAKQNAFYCKEKWDYVLIHDNFISCRPLLSPVIQITVVSLRYTQIMVVVIGHRSFKLS